MAYGHVGVQHHRGAPVAVMDAAMDVEGARLDRILALDDVALAVGHHQVGRRDLRPVQALRIDQEQLLAAGHGHAEVIAHALVQAMARRRPQRRRQVEPRLRAYRVVAPASIDSPAASCIAARMMRVSRQRPGKLRENSDGLSGSVDAPRPAVAGRCWRSRDQLGAHGAAEIVEIAGRDHERAGPPMTFSS